MCINVGDESCRFWNDWPPRDASKLRFERLTKNVSVQQRLVLGSVCVKWTIRQTHENLVAVDLKHIAECVWGIRAFDETLLWCDADEMSPWLDCQLDRLDALFKVISENVLDGKVVAHRVKRTCKRRLANVTGTQKPHPETNVKCPLLRL